MPTSENKSPSANEQTFLRYPQMAARLGIKTRCLKNWVSDGLVPYIKINRSVLFDPERVEQALRKLERN